jgi:uncharacterized protein (TIGR02271 family)
MWMRRLKGQNHMADVRPTTVVGVFNNRSKADETIAALQKAGFQNDQIRYSSERKSQGEVIRDLIDMGVAPEDIKFYQRECEAGHPLVSVTSSTRIPDATSILLSHGAYGPEKRAAASTASGTGAAAERREKMPPPRIAREEQPSLGTEARMEQREKMPPPRTAREEQPSLETEARAERREKGSPQPAREGRPRLEQEQHMRLHAEQLRAYKQPHQAGEVILRKEVVSSQESLDVPVTREEVVVERRTLAEDASAAEEPIGAGQTIRIPIHDEEVRVSKQNVTIGEVIIGKHELHETRHITETVRREEARLEREGDVPIWDMSPDHPLWDKSADRPAQPGPGS